MFNAPRRMGGNLASSAFISSSSANPSFDPLAASMPAAGSAFGEVDPWSAVPSPARSGTPRRESDDIVPPVLGNGVERSTTGREGLNALLDDPPALYLSLLDSLDPQPSGTIPLSSVHRLLSTSRLPASTIEHILTLTARDASYLSRTELFCALALVALAQSSHPDEDINLERLSQSIPTLPLPNLSPASPRVPATAPAPFTPGDTPGASPWDTAPRQNGNAHSYLDAGANGAPSGFSDIDQPGGHGQGNGGTLEVEAERGYWKKLEKVEVSLVSQKEGWFLQKYTVTSDRADEQRRSDGPVSRRYSDFVWLLDCLIKRYPFRLLPSLPPKRIGADAVFLEQRRKGLQRFLNMLTNHPVTRDDGALNVFLTESSFESWRKRTKVSTDEESVSKRLNTAQEMGIPADLEEKLGAVRDNLPALLAGYQKLVLLAERSLARLQAASADASRIALSLGSVGEGMPKCCFRGERCSLCAGVGRGLSEVGEAWTRAAELSEKRAMTVLLGSIEALKTQRDLYVAFRDLFVRHDKLSKDSVDALRKKVEGRVKKIEAAKSAMKAGWEVEVDKLVAANEQDNSAITSFLSRRVFIRACMWHELSVVFHSRQAAQATLGWRDYAREEAESAAGITKVWEELGERLKAMPVE